MILKSKQTLFLLQILRVQFLAVFTRQNELASRGGIGKQSTLWDLGTDWPQTVVQAWPLFSFLQKGVKDRKRTVLLFPEGLETVRAACGTFSNIEQSGSCPAFLSMVLACTFKGKKEVSVSSLCALLSVCGDDWWENGCIPLGWGK